MYCANGGCRISVPDAFRLYTAGLQDATIVPQGRCGGIVYVLPVLVLAVIVEHQCGAF